MNIGIPPEAVIYIREGLFLGMVVVTVFGAILATCAKRMIRSVLGLVVCFIGIAGVYYFLNSPFIALMQILVYVGAVAITICFAIMLAEPNEDQQARKTPAFAGPFAALLGGAVTVILTSAVVKATWMVPAVKVNSGSVKEIGIALLTKYSMVFELVSIVLLIAILGSLVISKAGRDEAC